MRPGVRWSIRPASTDLARGLLGLGRGALTADEITSAYRAKAKSCTRTKAAAVTATRWLPCKLHGTHCCDHSSDRRRAAARPISSALPLG